MLQTSEFEYVYPSLYEFLKQVNDKGFDAKKDLFHLLDFLVTTLSSSKGTQTRFRNEADRFVLFFWNERDKSVLDTNAEDIKLFIDLSWDPPKALISDTIIASRFKNKKKSDVRIVNEAWRPFVLRKPKANRKVESLIDPEAKLKSKHAYRLNQSSLQNSYASLNGVLATSYHFIP